jgi:hypothetical protein
MPSDRLAAIPWLVVATDKLLISPWPARRTGLTGAESAAVRTVRDHLRAANSLPAGVFWLDPATGRTTTIAEPAPSWLRARAFQYVAVSLTD